MSYAHKEDAVKYPRIQKIPVTTQLFLADSSEWAFHLLVIVGDYLLISPFPAHLNGQMCSNFALPRNSILLLEGPKIEGS